MAKGQFAVGKPQSSLLCPKSEQSTCRLSHQEIDSTRFYNKSSQASHIKNSKTIIKKIQKAIS